jgi:uncharacterized protein
MVEIHEPTRLAIVVEAPAERVLQIVRANPVIERFVTNRWLWLASLDVHTGALWELRRGTFVRHEPDHALPSVAGTSATWYQGKRGFLPPVEIVPEPTPPSRATASGAHA